MMSQTRLVRNVYDMSREVYMRKGSKNWCYSIHRLAIKYHLEDLWDENNIVINQEDPTQLKKSWATFLHKRVQEVEEKFWLETIRNEKKKPKLRTYKTFKTKLEMEPYLISEHQKAARYILTSIRTGTNKLRIDTGRYKKPVKEPVETRVCNVCKCGAIEDEKHFILDCKTYDALRTNMIDRIKINTKDVCSLAMYAREERWRILMNPQGKKSEITEPVKEFLKNAMKMRSSILSQEGKDVAGVDR